MSWGTLNDEMKKLYYICILISIFSCSSKNAKVIVPKDFCVLLSDDTEEINTYTSTVKRKYNHGDTTIHVEFSKREIETIYKVMLENQPFISSNENRRNEIVDYPSFKSKIQIEMNGNVYQMEWTTNDSASKNKKLGKFLKTIYEILDTKNEYINLPKTDIIFF